MSVPLEVHCMWCGGAADAWRAVVSGPGVNICSDCIDLVAAIMAEAGPIPPAPDEPPANCGQECPHCCAVLAKAHARLKLVRGE